MLFSRKKRAEKQMRELAGIGQVPAFPTSVTRVLDELRDPDSSMAQVAEAVSWDPGLVVRLLKLVNSSAYGLRRPVESCQHAVGFLGRANLESLLLGLAVEGALPPGPAPGFDPKGFWRGSAQRAALARLLAERLDPAGQAEAFTVGLLQDLAVPVLAHARGAEYAELLAAWSADPSRSLADRERGALGFDHAQLGSILAESWELPERLVEGIRQHHGTAADAVRLAAHLPYGGTPDVDQVESLVAAARDEHGLAPGWTAEALERSHEQALELAHLMS